MSHAEMSREDLAALVAKYEAENKVLRVAATKKQRALEIKVSPKGAVQINGLQRFPTTLYADQWTRLLEQKEEILAFIENHRDQLATKD